ncbi:chromosome partitioning protein, ParB family [Sphingomonas laterariae]|uniref:Chromosome partitioning protein, ParB family n=1 Tax=Edaphosphingomonas laterariae TaxID=861865 RepID=A0A239I780_9SPHN|nr:ParB N-terminal domain-containing protein [Sphingomonas laterariae]SNS88184.1 chromosome partitioning protein, ParB family [Sphingomonas laterariae]
MKLEYIPLDKLCVSLANMRHGRKAPDVADILPTIRKRGVLQTLVVRPLRDADADDAAARFEILAGRRRFHAAGIIAAEQQADGATEAYALPCAIIDERDHAAAIEASLIENLARLDPNEVTQWESFTRLVKAGEKPDDIAATFGLPGITVRRILALGNLLPRIRALHAAEAIDRATVRHLTMASKNQQRAWLALHDDPDTYCPTGHQLKAWLFGGQSIPVRHALFDVNLSACETVADLFGEDRYFIDAESFWVAQNQAIEERRAAYLDQGWADVVVIGPNQHFQCWEHEKAPKRKGGRVYMDVRSTGEVICHEGYVTHAEARRKNAADAEPATSRKPPRPELSGPMQSYVDLHRHAAVRARLLDHGQIALRLMIAHAIAGSPLWNVRADPQATRNEAIRDSVAQSPAEATIAERRCAILHLLGLPPDEAVIGRWGDEPDIPRLFARLLELPDPAIMEVTAFVMAESLSAGSDALEAVGSRLEVEMHAVWQTDDCLLDLVRDRAILLEMLAEIAGEPVARANGDAKAKALRCIIRDCLAGTHGREKVEGWVPRWMRFPPSAYTARGGVASVAAHARIQSSLVEDLQQISADPREPSSDDAPQPAD